MRARLALLLAILTVVSAETAAAETHVLALDARGYLDVGGGAWVPQGDLAHHASAAPSWSIQMGMGPKRFPFTIGLGAGAIASGSRSDAGPSGVWVHDGGVDFGPTTLTTSVELRHVEGVFRFEPDWPRLRPFLEATAGVVQYWTTTSMRADWTGGVLNGAESARDFAAAFGLGGGLILSPLRPIVVAPRADGTGGGAIGFALTIGVRFVRGGDIAVATPDTPAGASTMLVPARDALRAVAPYASLTMTFRSADALRR